MHFIFYNKKNNLKFAQIMETNSMNVIFSLIKRFVYNQVKKKIKKTKRSIYEV